MNYTVIFWWQSSDEPLKHVLSGILNDWVKSLKISPSLTIRSLFVQLHCRGDIEDLDNTQVPYIRYLLNINSNISEI